MSQEYRHIENSRMAAFGLVGALAVSGLCLMLSILAGPLTVIWRYLLVGLGATIAGLVLLWLGTTDYGFWWIPPCAVASLGIALSLGLKVIIPSTSNLFSVGVVLASSGLGLSLVITNPRSPHIILAVNSLVLFIAELILVCGIGYSFNWITLVFVVIGFGFATAAIYFPMVILYVVAGVLAALSLLCAPNPESGLRLLLPALLIIGGLTALRYSRKQS